MTLRCLIVDDNATFLEAARAVLERQGVAVVDVASTGADAVDRVRDLRPDVVLVDVKLGSESGFEVARRLAGTGVDGLSVILISTHVEADLDELIDHAPVAGFVPKARLSAQAIQELVDAASRGE